MKKKVPKIDIKKPFFDNGLPPIWICNKHLVVYYKSPISFSGIELPCCEIEKKINRIKND
ncbi:MAG: hypothetical protein AABY15_01325 [Nanoarchaeota archaeon]